MALALVAGGIVYFDELKLVTGRVLGIAPIDLVQPVEATGTGETADNRRRNGTVELKATSNGHFVTKAEINGRAIEVMVDTGATIVALTYEDAERAGVFVRESDFTQRVSTANGYARVAPIELERISIGDILVRNVRAAVAEPGRLQQSLLGMTFLGKLTRTEMSRGVLILAE